LRHDVFEQRLGVDQAVVVADADARGAHLDLLGRLLARDVERLERVGRQGNLQREGRLADAGLAAQQYERAGDQSAAQHAVHLAVAQVDAPVVALADVADPLRARGGEPAGQRRGGRRALAGDELLGEGVPFAARGAAAEPLRGFEAAILAEVCFLDLGHGCGV